jgi:FixJ family two-component response regulator
MKPALQKRIFIVDSDPSWNMKMTQILTNLGYTNVVSFNSGEDCVNNLHLNPVIIFLDYQMKAMDGLEVLRRAKEYFPGIDIVFCTTNNNINLAVNAMKSGSFDFLLKQNVTEEKIRNVLESFGTVLS